MLESIMRRLGYVPAAELEAAKAEVEAEKSAAASYRKEMRDGHRKELADVKSRVDDIVERCSRFSIYLDYATHHYRIAMDFNARAMYGSPREELEIIAERFASRVEREIVTSKFVKPPERY